MIFDNLDNLEYYFNFELSNLIRSEITKFSLDTEDGIYKSKNDNIYYKIVSYKTSSSPEIMESHLKEIDLQIPIIGSEVIEIYDQSKVNIKKPYNADIDCIFYEIGNDPELKITLKPNKFALFTPNDVHRCQIINNKEETIKKIVIKIDEKFFRG